MQSPAGSGQGSATVAALGAQGPNVSTSTNLYLLSLTCGAWSPGRLRRHVISGHMTAGAGADRGDTGSCSFRQALVLDTRSPIINPTALPQTSLGPQLARVYSVTLVLASWPSHTSCLLARALGGLVSLPVRMLWARAIWPHYPTLSPFLRSHPQPMTLDFFTRDSEGSFVPP